MYKRSIGLLLTIVLLLSVTCADAADRILGDDPLGFSFPSPQSTLRRSPDSDYFSDNIRYQTYSNFGEEDYTLYSKLLTTYNNGWLDFFHAARNDVKLISLTEDTIVSYISNDSITEPQAGITIIWNWKNQTLECKYGPGFYAYVGDPVYLMDDNYVSDSTWENKETLEGFLPFPNAAFGKTTIMPSIDMALKRNPDSQVVEENSITYVFLQFTDSDYDKVGTYFQKEGCVVADYSVDGNKILLTLNKEENTFSIVYDRDLFVAEAKYSQLLEPEKYTPPTQTTSSFTYTRSYDEATCYDVAVQAIKATLKNPESLQIHNHYSNESDDNYTFTFDYSAMNGFGGYNRETYYVIVSKKTGKVVYAWSN